VDSLLGARRGKGRSRDSMYSALGRHKSQTKGLLEAVVAIAATLNLLAEAEIGLFDHQRSFE